MSAELVERIKQCPNLPSLPALAVQVLELAQTPEADIAEIARVICKDPALSTKILRTVNSSFYGRSHNVGTISQALVILGLQSVKTLVLGFSLVTSLKGDKTRGFQHIDYWRRSIYSATAARVVAAKLGVVQQEEAFLAALLQDIGMLVLDQVLGAEYGKVHEKVTNHAGLSAAETEALGMDHAAVGALMAGHWRLPPILSTPIGAHCAPDRVTDPTLRKLTEVVAFSGTCAEVFVDAQPAAAIAEVRKWCGGHAIAEADCDAMLEEIGRSTREVAKLFEISLGSIGSFEDVLRRASEALVQLTLNSHQQTTALQERNRQLQEDALTDPLTGLANRRRLETFLAEQFAAGGPNAAFSVLMMDVDHFKAINDKYGHATGDRVLKALGGMIRMAARPTDVAARYGGEEMVLVLPGTPRTVAGRIAETVRRAVAAKSIPTNLGPISVTISIGVASLEPGSPLKKVEHLLKAADTAVYAAKHAGRNCVRMFAVPAKPPAGAAA